MTSPQLLKSNERKVFGLLVSPIFQNSSPGLKTTPGYSAKEQVCKFQTNLIIFAVRRLPQNFNLLLVKKLVPRLKKLLYESQFFSAFSEDIFHMKIRLCKTMKLVFGYFGSYVTGNHRIRYEYFK